MLTGSLFISAGRYYVVKKYKNYVDSAITITAQTELEKVLCLSCNLRGGQQTRCKMSDFLHLKTPQMCDF